MNNMVGVQEFGSGPGGPMISGKWINKLNGTVINVRDCVINGDEMLLMTDRGQMSMNEFSKNYIQASSDVYDEKGNVIRKEELDPNTFISQEPVMETVAKQHPQQQVKMFSDTTLAKATPNKQQVNAKPSQESEKERLIKTIFDKTPTPELSVNINWTEFPLNELSMLINYFDVTKEDIANYISKTIDPSQIMGSIVEFLESKLPD